MVPEKKLMEQAFRILQQKGQKSVDFARQRVFQEHVNYEPLKEALIFFMQKWNDVLHPALVSLACEAVGGKAEATVKIGAALVLLAGGADIHDDIIDQSVFKGSEQTVLGKFGIDIALLAGDSLLFKGAYLLHEACETLGELKKRTILDLLSRVFLEISSAEAAEANMKGRVDIQKRDYLDVIRDKVAAGEASSRIGAVIGGGSPEETKILAEFGRTYGYLLSIRDEFIDIFEHDELTNRIKRECLPLPILLVLKDASKRSALLELLHGIITEDKIEKIVDIVTNDRETVQLFSEMKFLVEKISAKLSFLPFCSNEFGLLLEATLEDL